MASVPLEDTPKSRELARIHIGVDVVILEDDLTMHEADCILVPSIALNLKYTQNNAGKILMGKGTSSAFLALSLCYASLCCGDLPSVDSIVVHS